MRGLAIYPQADVLAVIFQEVSRSQTGSLVFSCPFVHLRSMTTGQPHPGAKLAEFSWATKSNGSFSVRSTSITNSRFAMVVSPGSTDYNSDICVWDWKTGETIFTKTYCGYYDLNFINEHSFVVLSTLSDRQCHVFDTECWTEPTETIFSIPSPGRGDSWFRHSSEPCGHTLSPDKLLVPFYPDPSQRITVFDLAVTTYVIKTELLLKLARERRGQHFKWSEWGWATIEVETGGLRGGVYSICVSGCRMFCMTSGDQKSCLQVYDFSYRGRAKNLKVPDEVGESERKRRMSSAYKFPWDTRYAFGGDLIAGCDSIVFCFTDPLSASKKLMYLWSV